jgi:hypothetical protein
MGSNPIALTNNINKLWILPLPALIPASQAVIIEGLLRRRDVQCRVDLLEP